MISFLKLPKLAKTTAEKHTSEKFKLIKKSLNCFGKFKIDANNLFNSFEQFQFKFQFLFKWTSLRSRYQFWFEIEMLRTCDFPVPALPSTNTECLTSISSCSCTHLVMKASSGCSDNFKAVRLMRASNSLLRFRGTLIEGNRSPINPMHPKTSAEYFFL